MHQFNVLLIQKFKTAIVHKFKIIYTTLQMLEDIVFQMMEIIYLQECKQEYKLLKVSSLRAQKENT